MSDLTAPSEGAAGSPGAIADELCNVLIPFDHIDYNALAVEELRDLLAARDTIDELCLRYRRQQPSQENRAEATEAMRGNQQSDRREGDA